MIPAAYRSSHRGYDGIPGILEEALQSTLPGSVIVTKVAPSLHAAPLPHQPSYTDLFRRAREQYDAFRATMAQIREQLDDETPAAPQSVRDIQAIMSAARHIDLLAAPIDLFLPLAG